ncbi:TerD family protein [Streptomyces sp. NPDC091371]|uniref:TerD family protein n=1 Tax=Streptomyces sp. NPDC091371 TaxID=3155303 RepID=UPI0034163547
MSRIPKGANSFVPTVALRVAVRHELRPGAPLLGASALLLDASGRARGEADMVFWGRPVHGSGAVRHAGSDDTSTQWLELDLPAIEAEVERVLVVCSTDSGTVGALVEPAVEAFAPDGVSVVRYTVTDATTETAFVFGEFYRRAGGWKFRAVGQGYASGLAGLAADFGVDAAAAGASTGALQTPSPAPAPAETPVPQPSGPVPIAGVSKVKGEVVSMPPVLVQTPAPGAGPASSAVESAPFSPPGGEWTFGPVFESYTIEGEGNQVITADTRIPPGPVLIEMTREGDGYFAVERLNEKNKKDGLVFNTTLEKFRGSMAVEPVGDRPLRLMVRDHSRWTLTFKPLAHARRLETTLTGRGPEALLYTGPAAKLKVKFWDQTGGSYCGMYGYEVAGHPTIAAAPKHLLVNEAGRIHWVSSPLPEGHVLLLFNAAEGSWHMKVRPV